MRPKHHLILYTFLGLALTAALLAALQADTRARAAALALEDAYTQRVLETQEHLQAIALKLGKAPITESGAPLTELLAGVSQQAGSVVAELSALPLSHVAMADTVKFCNQLSEYSLLLALSAAGGETLNEEELAQLASLRSQCALLLGQFVTARDQMLSESLQLATQQNVYYEEAQRAARPLEQVSDTDNGMDYPTMIYDGAFSDARHYGQAKALGTSRIDAAQAVEIASRYVGAERVREATQSVQTEGSLAAYGVTLTLTDGTQLNAEVTKQGGKLLWMMPEHASFSQERTLEECRANAEAFLKQREYGAMEPSHYQVYDGLAVINFVSVQDEVLLYPDLVKVQLRMDTGEVVGVEANNYLMNHQQRELPPPALSRDEAIAGAAERLSVEDARLCLIPYRGGERLCWEIIGRYENAEYRQYLDATTGEQLELLSILQTTEGVLSA